MLRNGEGHGPRAQNPSATFLKGIMLHGKSYKHLSFEERALLQTQLVMGWSPAAIAAKLQRARSTITREMARNGWQAEPGIRCAICGLSATFDCA